MRYTKCMDKFDLGWIVGILEGEGCFTTHSPSRTRQYLQVAVAMSDEDTIKRLSGLLNASYHKRPDNRPGRLMMYRTQVNGRRAEALMREVRPFLSARRSARIQELLSVSEDGKVRRPAEEASEVSTTAPATPPPTY